MTDAMKQFDIDKVCLQVAQAIAAPVVNVFGFKAVKAAMGGGFLASGFE